MLSKPWERRKETGPTELSKHKLIRFWRMASHCHQSFLTFDSQDTDHRLVARSCVHPLPEDTSSQLLSEPQPRSIMSCGPCPQEWLGSGWNVGLAPVLRMRKSLEGLEDNQMWPCSSKQKVSDLAALHCFQSSLLQLHLQMWVERKIYHHISSHNHLSSYIIIHHHISSYIIIYHHISYLCIISHHGRKHLQTLCSKLEALISLPRFERALNHSTVWSVGVARRPVLASGDDHRISPDCIYMRHHEASTV